MKTRNNFQAMIVAVCMMAFTAPLLTSCDKDDDNNNVDNRAYTVSGNANGTQVVPSVTTTATGTINGSYDPSTRTLTYTTAWTGLSGAPTGGGFYNGAAGTTGSLSGTAWAFDGGVTGTGTQSGTVILTSDQETQLLNGNYYYSYATTANPAGEVRGQITATR